MFNMHANKFLLQNFYYKKNPCVQCTDEQRREHEKKKNYSVDRHETRGGDGDAQKQEKIYKKKPKFF